MRKFKEYELIQEDEYLITIEYWYLLLLENLFNKH